MSFSWSTINQWIDSHDKLLTGGGTIVIAAFTVILAIATIFLFIATRNLVEGSDNTSQRQLRAYVGIHSGETTVYPFEKGGYAFISHVQLRNYGQTPAHDVRFNVKVKIDVPNISKFDDVSNPINGPAKMMFRDSSIDINAGWPISEEDKVALYERKKVFYLWGEVKYRDVFSVWHSFNFHLVSAQIATGTGGVYVMEPYGNGYQGD